jgi:hypothetical protein
LDLQLFLTPEAYHVVHKALFASCHVVATGGKPPPEKLLYGRTYYGMKARLFYNVIAFLSTKIQRLY